MAVTTDPSQALHDRSGRTLAYLKTEAGWDYSVEAVRSGTAESRTYGERPVEEFDAITATETEARDQGKGIWGPPCWTEHRAG